MEVKYRTAVYSLANIKKVLQNSTFYYEEVVDFDFSYYEKVIFDILAFHPLLSENIAHVALGKKRPAPGRKMHFAPLLRPFSGKMGAKCILRPQLFWTPLPPKGRKICYRKRAQN